jgi:hypothetical protein
MPAVPNHGGLQLPSPRPKSQRPSAKAITTLPGPTHQGQVATAPSFKVRAFRHDKPRYRMPIPLLWFKAQFTISMDAFGTQKL